MNQNSDVIKEIYRTKFFGKSRGLSREELVHTANAERILELMKSGELVSELVNHTETKIWNDTINTQTNFLQTKMRNIPFDQQLELYRCMSSPHDNFPLSANQKGKISDIWLGIEELQLDNDSDDGDNGSIDEEESPTELLSDNDDDDNNNNNNNTNTNTNRNTNRNTNTTSDDTANENEQSDANDSYSVGEESSSGERISDDDDEDEDSDGTVFCLFCFLFIGPVLRYFRTK